MVAAGRVRDERSRPAAVSACPQAGTGRWNPRQQRPEVQATAAECRAAVQVSPRATTDGAAWRRKSASRLCLSPGTGS